jgi:hypothetical protein
MFLENDKRSKFESITLLDKKGKFESIALLDIKVYFYVIND